MGRPKEGNYSTMTLNLERDEVERFMSNLPRFKSLSEVVRQFIHDENVRIEKEKKETPLPRGAINYVVHKTNKDFDNKQAILDIFPHIYDDDTDKVADIFTDLSNGDKNKLRAVIEKAQEYIQLMNKK